MEDYQMNICGECEICGTRVRRMQTTDGKTVSVEPKPVPFYASSVGNLKFITDDGRVHYGIYEPDGNKIGYIPHKCKK